MVARFPAAMVSPFDSLTDTRYMAKFDSIRPYHDAEVRPTLERLVNSREMLHSVLCIILPRTAPYLSWLLRPLLRWYLKRKIADIHTVDDFQFKGVIAYFKKMVKTTNTQVSYSGLERLNPEESYLFISNHRDIAMDPAFTNWALHFSGFPTVRIAIGDNLLSKPFVEDLMRLNKSFVVKRGLSGAREKLLAAKELSAYIRFSLQEENASIWIAQREGRAKDGLDKTQPAVLKMIGLGKDKQEEFGDYMAGLKIVPVAISYEWDPCDAAKANELYQKAEQGSYEKEEHEDVASIAAGITGKKGRVHIAFGKPIEKPQVDADVLAASIDRQIWCNYRLMPTNYYAYRLREGKLPPGVERQSVEAVAEEFEARLATIPTEQRDIFLHNYANPVYVQLAQNDD